MGFLSDGAYVLGICVGIIVVLLVIILAASFILDYDPTTTIEDNKTIALNGVMLTVPVSSNYSVNNSTKLDYYSYMKSDYGKLDLGKIDNFNAEGTASEYYDFNNHIKVMVINQTDVPYITSDDEGETIDSVEGEGRVFQQQRTIDGKVVLVWVYDDCGKSLAKKIVDNAKLVE